MNFPFASFLITLGAIAAREKCQFGFRFYDKWRYHFLKFSKKKVIKKEVVALFATTSFFHFIIFSLKLFSTTLTLERAIRALARVGVIWKGMSKT